MLRTPPQPPRVDSSLPTVASGGMGIDMYDDLKLTPFPVLNSRPKIDETKLTDGDLVSLMEKIQKLAPSSEG